MTNKISASDMAILERVLASRAGTTKIAPSREALEQAERDADVADEIRSQTREGVVTKLPEVHDHAGDDLPFHIPAGRATQVLGSREIDISRIPDTQNVAVTDSNGRALPTRSAIARETAILKALTGNEPLAKLARKYGAKHFSFTMSR